MSEERSEKAAAMPGWTWLVLVLVVALHAVWWVVAGRVTATHAEAGALGDRFGFLTSLLSGLAFWGLIVTMVMQRQELALQREELKLQRAEMAESREELAKAAEHQRVSNEMFRLDMAVRYQQSIVQYRLANLDLWMRKFDLSDDVLIRSAGDALDLARKEFETMVMNINVAAEQCVRQVDEERESDEASSG